jgi:hypothetical protein
MEPPSDAEDYDYSRAMKVFARFQGSRLDRGRGVRRFMNRLSYAIYGRWM